MRPILTLMLMAGLAGPMTATAALAEPTAAERTMMTTVQSEHARHVDLLERMVNVNSGTLNLAGVRAVGDMVRAELEPLGFDVRWIHMAETGRAGHLIATHDGPGRNVLLIGHLDTVFEANSPFQTFVRDGDRATGPGIGDDKGGVVVIVAAMRAMQAAGTLADADITIVLTGDEERIGTPVAVARRTPDRRRPGRRLCPGVREPGQRGRSGFRHDRATQQRQLDPDDDRPHRPFQRHLQRDARLWRDLRDDPHPRRLPHRTARAEPDL